MKELNFEQVLVVSGGEKQESQGWELNLKDALVTVGTGLLIGGYIYHISKDPSKVVEIEDFCEAVCKQLLTGQ